MHKLRPNDRIIEVEKLSENFIIGIDPLLLSSAILEPGTELSQGLNQLETKLNQSYSVLVVFKVYLIHQPGHRSQALN